MGNKKTQRKISLEKDFMSHKQGNDLLYGYMISRADFDPITQQTYLTKYDYCKMRPDIKKFFGDKGINYVSENLKELIKRGLIKEGTIDIPDFDKVKCYIFSSPTGKYELVDNDMIFYVINTHNMCALRIYVYLLNKYNWIQKQRTIYSFTIKQLHEALNWAPTSCSCDTIIKNVLDNFCNEGIMEITKGYEVNENNMPIPLHYLHFIAKTGREIKYIR